LSILAAAVAFEYLAMSISKTVLETGLLRNAEENMRNFWSWHMMEEIEHRNEVMDLYQRLGGGYFRRIAVFTYVLVNSCYYGARIYFKLLQASHASRLKGTRYLFGRQAFLLKGILFSLRFYRRHYHPSMENMEYLIDFTWLQR
jgi:predicted metal-dependent hydrolase